MLVRNLSPLFLLSSLIVHPGESGAIALPTTKHHTDVASANVAVHEYTQEISPKRLKLQEEPGPGKSLLVEALLFCEVQRNCPVALSSSFQTTRLI